MKMQVTLNFTAPGHNTEEHHLLKEESAKSQYQKEFSILPPPHTLSPKCIHNLKSCLDNTRM